MAYTKTIRSSRAPCLPDRETTGPGSAPLEAEIEVTAYCVCLKVRMVMSLVSKAAGPTESSVESGLQEP